MSDRNAAAAAAAGARDGGDEEGEADIDYGGIVELLEDDEYAEGDDADPDLHTLAELQSGKNKATANMLVSHAIYAIATVMDLVALALVSSDAGPHPRIFNSETRQFVEKHGIVNIGIGNKAPFLRGDDEDELTDEEVNPLENDDDIKD